MTKVHHLFQKLKGSQDTTFKEFSKLSNATTYIDLLRPRSYYESYRLVYLTTLVFALLSQLASGLSSYHFFANLLQVKLSHPIALMLGVGCVLGLIEVLKYVSLNQFLGELFRLTPQLNITIGLFAFSLSAFSIYASIIGGGQIGVDTTKELVAEQQYHQQVDSLATLYAQQVATLRQEIQRIEHRNSYKGNTYLPKQEKALVLQKEAQITHLLAMKDQEVNKTKQTAAQTLALIQTTNQQNEWTYRVGFGCFDLLFVLCTLFVWHYRKRVAVESLAAEEVVSSPAIQTPSPSSSYHQPQQEQFVAPQASPSHRIGFVFENLDKPQSVIAKSPIQTQVDTSLAQMPLKTQVIATRNCLHCGEEFTYKHWNKQYCSENCKILAWNKRTGKTFTKRKRG